MPHSSILPRALLALGLLLEPTSTAPGQTPEPARRLPEALSFANGLYRNRRFDLAAEEYEKFLGSNQPRTDLDAADARFGLGNARLFLGQYKEARRAFEEFVKAAPNHANAPTGLYRVGETAYVLGDLPAARKALEGYVEPGQPPSDRRYLQAAWSHLGDVDFRLNDLPAARKAYEAALLGNPQGSLASRARLGLGRVLAAQAEPEPALRVFRDLATQGGAEWSDKAWLEVGKIESALGRWKESAEALEALEKGTPRSPLVAEARIERAEALGKLDRHEEAESVLRLVLDEPSQPLAGQAADALGSSLLARGKPMEAVEVFDRAATRFAGTPSASSLRYHSAEAWLAMGKLNEARTRFLQLATDDPKSPSADDAQLRAASMTLDAKDPTSARRLAAFFLAKFPDSPLRADARVVAARASLALNQPKEAIQGLETAFEQDKPSPAVAQAAYYYLGLAYQKDGQPEKANEVLARLAKDAAPVAADARYLLGQADFDAGRFEPAIASLEKYLLDKPKGEVAADALARIAQAQSELERPDEADATLARLAEAYPASPTLPPTRLRLAEAALLARRYDRSTELFRLAAESNDPASKARARSGLGWSLLRGGQPLEAAAAFASLLEATPDDPPRPRGGAGPRLRPRPGQAARGGAGGLCVGPREIPQSPPGRPRRARPRPAPGRRQEARGRLEDLRPRAQGLPDHRG